MHINELMQNHERAFKEMKEYYNDITRENLELIKTNRERYNQIKKNIEDNSIKVTTLKQALK
jgi:hypothetical protein